MTKPDGPFTYEHPASSEALRAASLPKRKPTENDGVPAAGPPMSKAQRIALDLNRSGGIVER